MIAHRSTPSESWSFIVTALAELGRAEIERQQHAAEMCAHVQAAEDQAGGRLSSTSAMKETTAILPHASSTECSWVSRELHQK